MVGGWMGVGEEKTHLTHPHPILPFRTPEKFVPSSTYFVSHLDFSNFPVIK
jgi:hypothetical protein